MKMENIDRKREHQDLDDNNNDPSKQKNVANDAREEAFEDIADDADLSIHSPNDDLDEGETARLGEDKTDLI